MDDWIRQRGVYVQWSAIQSQEGMEFIDKCLKVNEPQGHYTK